MVSESSNPAREPENIILRLGGDGKDASTMTRIPAGMWKVELPEPDCSGWTEWAEFDDKQGWINRFLIGQPGLDNMPIKRFGSGGRFRELPDAHVAFKSLGIQTFEVIQPPGTAGEVSIFVALQTNLSRGSRGTGHIRLTPIL